MLIRRFGLPGKVVNARAVLLLGRELGAEAGIVGRVEVRFLIFFAFLFFLLEFFVDGAALGVHLGAVSEQTEACSKRVVVESGRRRYSFTYVFIREHLRVRCRLGVWIVERVLNLLQLLVKKAVLLFLDFLDESGGGGV